MMESLLIANRGEIACRIARTARRLGVRTVAVYSDADAGARHVREADEAVRIGPAPSADSYLHSARLIAAAQASGAEAIHPGYGFLSENARFAQACAEAGLIFVGPPAAAIAAMGSKILAKSRMQAVGVPVLPGYAGAEQGLEHLEREAGRLGLPLIIKPAAGGGGKGMQIVRERAQLAPALAAARRLAESAFGDGALLLERYLPAPRHVEVQVFADTHGNLIHLGDRDCSIQRRHQKLIEEAPAPGLAEEVRSALRAAALVVAREIGYVSAGTVEFLLDGREFYFMEMNTRLQVEHTVTEAITRLDLVEWQLRIAAGEALPLTQEQVRFEGHAIEARICAEDPERGFLPSAGRLELMQWPDAQALRVDAGFATGDVVPDSYDSLLGKIVALGETRAQAAARLAAALSATYIAGVHANERWLRRILRSARFLEVRHNIALLDESAKEFAQGAQAPDEALILAGLALEGAGRPLPGAGGARGAAGAVSPWELHDGYTPNLPARAAYSLSWRGHTRILELEYRRGALVAVSLNGGTPLTLADLSRSATEVVARIGAQRQRARYLLAGGRVCLWSAEAQYEFIVEDPRTHEFTASAATGGLTTPLPGVVVAVPVVIGQRVAAGEVLMVIEAMKMEHTITAPYAGSVERIHFARGERVPEGSALIELEQSADP